ncbi:MAG: hypothetical protein H6696_11205 [Deferribacteres bacterium]|nr:hypothetical protein [candidate division KSB1 bacterium]MCB9502499.1 hypothetical protein [Deferribacteres bacterium]
MQERSTIDQGYKKRQLHLAMLLGGFLTIIAVPSVCAQLTLPTIHPINSATFAQNLNIYDWQYQFGWGASPWNQLDFVTHYDYFSTMQYSRGEQLWKDQQNADLIIQKRALQNRILLTRFDFTSLKDQFSSFNYDRIQAGMTIAGRFPLKQDISIQPEMGFRMENRKELSESGPYFAINLLVPDQEFFDAAHKLDAWSETSTFKNRQNSQVRLNYGIFGEVTPGTRDSLNFYYDFLRRDNFLGNPLNKIVESLNKKRIGFNNNLHYSIGQDAGFRMITDLSIAGVDIGRDSIAQHISNRGHDDFDFHNNIFMYWHGENHKHQLAVDFGESSTEHYLSDSSTTFSSSQGLIGVGYDVIEKFTRISEKSQYRLSDSDSIRFYFGLSKLERDNTDRARSDTHDEQRWTAALLHSRRLSEFITLRWELSTYLRHFVYLNSQLSGQNNWTRILKFQPECIIRFSPQAELRQKAGIRTNYVVSDFASDNSLVNNYVIRDYFITDSLAIEFSEKLTCLLDYRYETEELGSLNWRKFSSRPRTAWRNQWGTLKFQQRFTSRAKLGLGVVFYEQKRWNYELNTENRLKKEHVGTHTNLGPVAEFLFIAPNGSVIVFNGKRQKAFPFIGKAYYINNLELRMQWKF